MKPSRLAFATIATTVLAGPGLAVAQPDPDQPLEDPPAGAEVDAPAEPMPEPAPEPAPEPKASGSEVHVKYDKGFTFETADEAFELKAGIRSQFRFEAVKRLADGNEFNDRFSIPRLRLQLEGHAYGKANGYKVEFDMANKGFALLKDFYVDHAFSKTLHLRAGQWKRPFNRQEMVSDFGSEFLERSLANEFAGGGRDLGVALHNDYEKSPEGLEWAAGVFNAGSDKPSQKTTCTGTPPTCATGLPTNVPTDFGPALVLHAGWNQGKIKGYSEGDLEGGPLRLAVGASYKLDFRRFDKDANGDLDLQHAVSIDTMIKVSGLGVSGALVLVKNGAADLATGFYGQAGYMLQPKKLLGVVRFAQVPEGDEKKFEVLGGVDLFWKGHSAKWMIDGGVIHTTAPAGTDATSDLQIRTQLQLVL